MEIVLVTGAAGFIGSHLSEKLLVAGYKVIGLDNFDPYYPTDIKRENISLAKIDKRYRLIKGDIRNKSTLKEIFGSNGISRVAHLAARAGVRASFKHPDLYLDVNISGTINLLEMSQEHKVKQFLFASSSSVYGKSNDIPFREDARIGKSSSPYAYSKGEAEAYCRLYELPVTIIRPFTVYGPRQRPDMAISLFTQLIKEGKEIPIFGDGSSQRDYTYISDIVDGMFAALTSQNKGFEIFNLGNSHPVPLIDMVRILEKDLGEKAKIKYLPDQKGDVSVTYADISKAMKYLGYNPQVMIEDGIRRYIEWVRKGVA
jgi:UDP-glucuronate 4-epimerase